MTHNEEREALTCGDGALFVMNLTLRWLPIQALRALPVDLPVYQPERSHKMSRHP